MIKIFKKINFPFRTKQITKHYKYSVVLGIGGNIGNTKKRFQQLLNYLQKDNRLQLISTSIIVQNPPFGYIDQNDFFNTIIIIKTDLHPIKLLDLMQKYELKFKRKRSFKNAPRTLDIDIIFIKKYTHYLKINHPRLKIPHPFWDQRDSVLIPLSYLNDFLHKKRYNLPKFMKWGKESGKYQLF
jgi:2-amino-4-hydroxy-6-hydroxymethyldihydropteridine diphosphokinase